MSQLYSKLLSTKGHGYPLFIPEPNENLPYEYRRRGVGIGDVGIITSDGAFDFLFSVCLPATHPINKNNVPEGFVPLMLETRDIVRESLRFPPGTIISSSHFRRKDEVHAGNFNGNDGYLSTVDIKLNKVPIAELTFESEEGAFLILPEGASREDFVDVDNLRNHGSLNAAAYYNFANGRRGRMANNHSLFIVTGCDKARSWKLASFSCRSNTNLSGKVDNITYSIQSECSDSIQSRFGPIPSTDTENQCVFLRGLVVSLQKRVNRDVEVNKLDISGRRKNIGERIQPDVLEQHPAPHSDRSNFLHNLGNAINTRFKQPAQREIMQIACSLVDIHARNAVYANITPMITDDCRACLSDVSLNIALCHAMCIDEWLIPPDWMFKAPEELNDQSNSLPLKITKATDVYLFENPARIILISKAPLPYGLRIKEITTRSYKLQNLREVLDLVRFPQIQLLSLSRPFSALSMEREKYVISSVSRKFRC